MTITERLQALLDGKALLVSGYAPRKLIEGELCFLSEDGRWEETDYPGGFLDPTLTCQIYEEPKPVERPRIVLGMHWSRELVADNLNHVLDYIDAKIDELKKELGK